ncbi:hypothetical protein KZX45_19355 [Georgenia sp. EYE_87]|uniref:hypothetical protein n=1 Tax=Georgenia sp. EYE_87 TaxID=2853448 RepID=UPI002003880D|nr:hypothetical protein [Georgenia sp. EYE_87]MCK6212700.1 hypothetical protein [Georgenia sp. EYE_87]
MRNRIMALGASVLAFLAVGLASATTASAAPITCPGGQTVTKTADGWDCINNGGNDSNAENPKNPNAGKDKF